MLAVRGLTKRFGDLLALDDVSFTVEPGEIVGFLGPNGAGKTTTMRAIMRLITLDAGTVSWRGAPIDAAVRQRFGYMPAERGVYPKMKVLDQLVHYARLAGLDRGAAERAAEGWLERLGLAERAGDEVQALSSGNQQRVQLALALINDPELLVLDEPFSGLDPVATHTLSGLLREQVGRGVALLLSSHQLDLVAAVCSKVVIVDHGRVVLQGDVATIRADSPTRVVEVEFAQPTGWRPEGADVTVLDDRRVLVRIPRGGRPQDLLAHAEAHGEVVAYSYRPPDLSEVFLRAVGRDQLDDGADAPGRAEAGR